MICPECSNPNAYAGLFGISCVNKNCRHFDSTATLNQGNTDSFGGVHLNSGKSIKNKNVDKQIDLSKQVISLIRQVPTFEFPIIAGGAPRSWNDIHRKEARDIDIYLVCENPTQDHQNEKIILLSLKLGVQIKLVSNPHQSVGYGRWIRNIYEFTYKGNNFQIMIISEVLPFSRNSSYNTDLELFADHVFKTFDFGICKIAFLYSENNNSFFYTHPHYDQDILNKTITLDIRELKKNNLNGMAKLVSRFQKMKSYFPDHELILI